jgi:hypothetical protein
MLECREKVSPALAFPPIVSCFSPASAFQHQGSVRYRWSRISPALPGCCMIRLDHNLTPSIVANLLHRERKTMSVVLFQYISSSSISRFASSRDGCSLVQYNYKAYYFSIFCLQVKIMHIPGFYGGWRQFFCFKFFIFVIYLRIQCPSGAGTQDTSSKDKPATGTEHFYLALTMSVMFCFFNFKTYRKDQLRFYKIR